MSLKMYLVTHFGYSFLQCLQNYSVANSTSNCISFLKPNVVKLTFFNENLQTFLDFFLKKLYVHHVNVPVIVGNTAKVIVKFHNGRRYPILYGSAQIHVIFFVFKHGFISLFGDFVTITFVQVPYCVLSISKRGPTFYAMYRKIQFLEGFIDEWKMLGHQVFFKAIFVFKFWRVLFTNTT